MNDYNVSEIDKLEYLEEYQFEEDMNRIIMCDRMKLKEHYMVYTIKGLKKDTNKFY